MEIDSNIINCPKCGEPINVSDLLFHQVQEQLSKEYDVKKCQEGSRITENSIGTPD